MRRIACKNHTSVTEIPDASTVKFIETNPLHFRFNLITKHPAYTPHHVFRARFLLGICFQTYLEIEPPNVIRLHVQQSRGRIRECWRKPETAHRRHVGLCLDVRYQKLVIKSASLEFKTQRFSAKTSRSVCSDQPITIHLI